MVIDRKCMMSYVALFCTILVDEAKAVCYESLGCFPTSYPWTSALRPFPEPMPPSVINTRLYLYTRKNKNARYNVQLWPTISLETSYFKKNSSYNVFMIHGFFTNGNFSWLQHMKNAYLSKRDANIFIVDWGDGAQFLNYLQVASNTRVVGAELARFGRYLKDNYGISSSTFHAIGHSLGAQISSYFGKSFEGMGRLTALDPAQPGFEHCDEQVRLSKHDAVFVEALHTNVRPFILLGLGMIQPIADVDIYANGGWLQPGCPVDIPDFSPKDQASLTFESIQNIIACSHVRAIHYYIEALEYDDCLFWAHSVKSLTNIMLNGISTNLAKVFSNVSKCTSDTCTTLGLETINYPGRGVFSLITNSAPRFCKIR